MAADQDDERKPQASPADVLRDAVERTFREAAGNVAGAGTRAQSLLDDAAAAIARLRESSGEDVPAPTAIETLTARVDALTRRLEALEAARPKASKTAARAKAQRDGPGPKRPAEKPAP